MCLLVLILILISAYYYSTKKFSYWSKRSVKHDQPYPLVGNNIRQLFRFRTTAELASEMYHKYPHEKVVGFYKQTTPVLIVRDLDIVKRILSLDFPHFHDRGLITNDVEIIYQNLLHARGDDWKLLRKKVAEAFTITKIKAMFPALLKCTDKLKSVADGIAANGEEFDARDLLERFAMEFIAEAGFGVDIDTINNKHSRFREIINLGVNPPLQTQVLQIICDIFPALRRLSHVHDRRLEEGVSKLVQNVLQERNYKPSGRGDFIDILLKIQAQGKMRGESFKKNPDGTSMIVEKEMDLPCLIAQVFIFFVTGFDTSSAAMSYTLHEIAYNPKTQRRIQKNIDEVLEKHNGKLSFEALFEMSVLKMAFLEGMRMRDPAGVIPRICTKTCTIPELNITIDPGVKILIPTQGIYSDDKHFKDPKEFLPDRFSAEEMNKRHKFSYLPFGGGPRMCLGEKKPHNIIFFTPKFLCIVPWVELIINYCNYFYSD